MQYGLRLKGETLEQLTDWARKAEAARFDMLWAQELYTTPFVYPPPPWQAPPTRSAWDRASPWHSFAVPWSRP